MKRGLTRAAFLAMILLSFGASARAAALDPTALPAAAEAPGFVARAETELAASIETVNRAFWVQTTFITDDTKWIAAKADAQDSDLRARLAKEAARYDRLDVDAVTRRKLTLLKRGLVLPPPSRAGGAQEMADISARLDTIHSMATLSFEGKVLTSDDVKERLGHAHDPAESRSLWEGWRAVPAIGMKDDYARRVALANDGARELGHEDTGALWRSVYDMPPAAFEAKVDALWLQVSPLYQQLHCYVRARLNAAYGDAVQPPTGPIRADLLRDLFGLDWSNIYDTVAPRDLDAGDDLTRALTDKAFTPEMIVRTAEAWYRSIGFPPEPATFWDRSILARPSGRDVTCHPAAWDIDDKEDLRISVCLRSTRDDFYTAHHELGHTMYQRAYKDLSTVFRDGANDGFHEAIGDFAGLNALAPSYLKRLGLIEREPGPDGDIPFLLRMALDKVAFLPYGILVDKWRWAVFAGAVTPARYNEAWWDLSRRYQGIAPPGPRPADAFDPGAIYHVAASVPYARYFLADIYAFQFHRAACRLAGWTGPLARCSVFGHEEVGARYEAMLKLGASRPWPEALAVFTGDTDIDASALTDYFAPLKTWLEQQNQGRACTW